MVGRHRSASADSRPSHPDPPEQVVRTTPRPGSRKRQSSGIVSSVLMGDERNRTPHQEASADRDSFAGILSTRPAAATHGEFRIENSAFEIKRTISSQIWNFDLLSLEIEVLDLVSWISRISNPESRMRNLSDAHDAKTFRRKLLHQNFVAPIRFRKVDPAVIVEAPQPFGDLELGRLRVGESERAEVVQMLPQRGGG